MQTGSSGTLIGWKSGQTTYFPLWDLIEGSWLWTRYNKKLVFVAVYNPVAEFWRSWITVAAPFVVLALPLTADPSVEKVRKGVKTAD
jgi:hypothetical protein